tara:strand:- start:20 stop:811 length:792 start_codon:yes stop_codon:yes gene_type:complete
MNIISLGAGVQSSTMAFMAELGEIKPMPDCAIFADTGAEPYHVYEYLDYIESIVSYPIYRVMHEKGLEQKVFDSINNEQFNPVPFFTESPKGFGILRRQCTREFKIQPVHKKIRELIGLAKGQKGPKEIAVHQWIGISTDEDIRAKENRIKWVKNIWPLISSGFSRQDCINWMNEKGFKQPKKSACYFCPYHDNKTWQDMKDNDLDSWNKAVKLDNMIRDGIKGGSEKIYIHGSGKPLTECTFDTKRDQHDMFDHECDGMCGV